MKAAVITGVVFTLIFVALIVILPMAMTFRGVAYYEYGFLRTKSTGEVDGSKIYTEGLYVIGPNAEFLLFKANAHFVELDRLAVATKEENALHMDVAFQYKLRKDRLDSLRRRYNTGYEEVLASAAREVVKQTTTRFTNEQILRERARVEGAIAESLAQVLEYPCCSPDCDEPGAVCKQGCTPASECDVKDDDEDEFGSQRNQFIELLAVQLRNIHLSDELKEEYLESILLDIKEEKAKLEQNISMVESETRIQVNRINLERDEVKQNASAASSLIRQRATAKAESIIQRARLQGLETLYTEAEISSMHDKNLLFYIRALKKNKINLNVDFDHLYRN